MEGIRHVNDNLAVPVPKLLKIAYKLLGNVLVSRKRESEENDLCLMSVPNGLRNDARTSTRTRKA
jgi:hypothetical protein